MWCYHSQWWCHDTDSAHIALAYNICVFTHQIYRFYRRAVLGSDVAVPSHRRAAVPGQGCAILQFRYTVGLLVGWQERRRTADDVHSDWRQPVLRSRAAVPGFVETWRWCDIHTGWSGMARPVGTTQIHRSINAYSTLNWFCDANFYHAVMYACFEHVKTNRIIRHCLYADLHVEYTNGFIRIWYF